MDNSSSQRAMDAPASSSLGAMGPLLRKLDSLVKASEFRLPKPLKDHIQLLKEDVEEILAALEEQSMVDSASHKARYWMEEVRELSYDIVDFIDTIMLRLSSVKNKTRSVHNHKVGRIKIPRLPKIPKTCTWIARITEFRALVRESIERHERYQIDDGYASSSRRVFTANGRARPLHEIAANKLIGIDEPKTKLSRWLTDEEGPHLKVATIVGPAGIGKTTLATELYREHRWRFECRAFVQAPRKPDMRRLLWGILSQVQRRQRPSGTCTDSTVQRLIDNLREYLQDNRYFIVIDGLWETSLWNIINNAFPDVLSFSRIIITTEIEHVALECCGYQSDYITRMKPLGSHDSGEVFFNRVFGSEDQCPDQLKELSNRIITKCGGLPLATISIAGLFASQPDNAELWDHVQKCLCFDMSTNLTSEDILKEILNLSYQSLPHYLKTCLLYLNMYPEGQTMLKADLLKQWIAEGFISDIEAKGIMEVADSYFHELVNRGMVQPLEINKNGEVLSCTVHHIVLDHVMHKSREEKFITSIDYSQTITGPSAIVRRLSLHFSSTRYASKPAGIMFSQVRSLAFFGLFKCLPHIMEFKLLRVLIVEIWGNHNGHMSLNLTPVCRLCQLKYLKISSDVIVELPAPRCGLLYLETLEVDASVSAMPFNIVHCPNLLHLRLPDGANLPDGIGCMRSMRTLQFFDLGNSSVDNLHSLGNLTNLQNLHLSYSTVSSNKTLKKNLIALAFSLSKLDNLRSLTISPTAAGMAIFFSIWNTMSSISVFLQRLELLPPIFIFHRLPKWIRQLHKLCILKVAVRELLTRDIYILTELPSLRVLSLRIQTAPEGNIIFSEGALPVLRYFKFECGVLCLEFRPGAMPNLQRLKLGFNGEQENYGYVLAGIEYLLNLQDIAARVGADTSVSEFDRRAVESMLKKAISKNPRCPRFNVRWVSSTDEEWHHLEKKHQSQEKGSSAGKYVTIEIGSAEDTDKHILTGHGLFSQPSGNSVAGQDWTIEKESVINMMKRSFTVLHQTFRKYRRKSEMEILTTGIPSQILREITDEFSDEQKVGEGAFGIVYKGVLKDGLKIAVKKLRETSPIHDNQFIKEVRSLMKVDHRNIVKLIDYCYEIQKKVVEHNGKYILTVAVEKLLCYEYISNGSLDKHIFGESSGLDWHTRLNIINGICQGLYFLHEGSERPIIHLDIKPGNILLDDNMVPKIADFGLSRLLGEEQTRVCTQNVMGAIGYMAPEYLYQGEISTQSDIYSLGLIIIEITTGEKIFPNREDIIAKNFIKNVRRNWTNRMHISAKYPSLDANSLQQVRTCIGIGLSCVQTNMKDRPSIVQIVNTLTSLWYC